VNVLGCSGVTCLPCRSVHKVAYRCFFACAIAGLWLTFGLYHLLFGQVASQLPSVGFLLTCALSLAAPFVYRRVQDWPRLGYTVLLAAANVFCVLLRDARRRDALPVW